MTLLLRNLSPTVIFSGTVSQDFFSLLLEEPAWRRDSASISFFQRAANECKADSDDMASCHLTGAPPTQRLGMASPVAMTTSGIIQMFAQVMLPFLKLK